MPILCVRWLPQDVCVKKDFDDLYSKITDTGREMRVVHGGVVELSYQPVPTARHLALAHHPFGTSPVPEKQTPAEQDAVAAAHEQVHSSFYLAMRTIKIYLIVNLSVITD